MNTNLDVKSNTINLNFNELIKPDIKGFNKQKCAPKAI